MLIIITKVSFSNFIVPSLLLNWLDLNWRVTKASNCNYILGYINGMNKCHACVYTLLFSLVIVCKFAVPVKSNTKLFVYVLVSIFVLVFNNVALMLWYQWIGNQNWGLQTFGAIPILLSQSRSGADAWIHVIITYLTNTR